MAIRNMLPLATGARPEVLAGSLYAMRRSLNDLLHYAGDHPLSAPSVTHDPRNHALAWNSAEHVDPLVLEIREAVAKGAYLVEEGQLGKFRRLVIEPEGRHSSIVAEDYLETLCSH